VKHVDLAVQVGKYKLKNPVMPASGTFGYGTEYTGFFDPNILGAIITKGVSIEKVDGNPSPRIYETPSGMINAIGLQNVGFKVFLEEKIPALKDVSIPVIANIWGRDEREYIEVAEKLEDVKKVDALEVNISCPNIKKGGLEFGRDPGTASELVSKIRRVYSKDLWVKVSPSAPSIAEMCRVLEGVGANVISLVNSIPAMVVDVTRRRPRVANIIGGLSGPAIRPIAVRMVYQAVNAVKIPVVGIGGICSAEDALEFLIVGAAAIQVGTAGFINPNVFEEIIEGLYTYCESEGIEKITDIIGSLEVN
jgi:dihydroorotate dehydrogenase (NAD+) catalytic subunit